MPELFQWLGLSFYFYSEEHEPIHVHVTIAERETVFEIIIENGVVTGIKSRAIGKRPKLTPKEKAMALQLIEKYQYGIIERWVKYFVWNKAIRLKKITTKKLP